MTPPNKLEWSIHPLSRVDSAQWDWGIRMKAELYDMIFAMTKVTYDLEMILIKTLDTAYKKLHPKKITCMQVC